MSTIEQASHQYLWEAAPVVALIIEEGVVCDANRYAREILGDDVVGKAMGDLAHLGPGAAASFGTPMTDLPERVHLALSDGRVDTYRLSVVDIGGQCLLLGAVDAEDREFAAGQIAELNDEIHNLARELARKNDELGRLNALKNRFLGMAAHDLRKPVGALLAYADILIDEASSALAPDHQRYLGIIRSSCDFMAQLIDDFLDVATIESGRLELRRAPTNPATVIRESLVLAEIYASRRSVMIEAEVPDFPPILLDPGKMEQVLNNLVMNAIDHSPAGATVTLTSSVSEGRWNIVVADQGTGIDPADLDRIFNPFERGSRPKSGAAKSTGLGLAIARKIVEGHRGIIHATSEPGAGSTFTVSLPAERSDP